MLPGVYTAKKKNGTVYFRSNITYKTKHISLGSFETEALAHEAYVEASTLLNGPAHTLADVLLAYHRLSFDKIVVLLNFRNNGIYMKTPIYLHQNYFSYYLSDTEEYKFDIDDLFYYSSHRLIKRSGHLYVNDYGMQYSILARYGIHIHSVVGRDYEFVNGDTTDFRYSNIHVINKYIGVTITEKKNKSFFQARIHLNGDYIIGYYYDEDTAAIAYNKAVDLAHEHGIKKNFSTNYLTELSAKEYADRYMNVSVSAQYLSYLKSFSKTS